MCLYKKSIGVIISDVDSKPTVSVSPSLLSLWGSGRSLSACGWTPCTEKQQRNLLHLEIQTKDIYKYLTSFIASVSLICIVYCCPVCLLFGLSVCRTLFSPCLSWHFVNSAFKGATIVVWQMFLTWQMHDHCGRFLLHPEDGDRLNHRITVERSFFTGRTAKRDDRYQITTCEVFSVQKLK